MTVELINIKYIIIIINIYIVFIRGAQVRRKIAIA